jgi:anti-sigma factor RsiW
MTDQVMVAASGCDPEKVTAFVDGELDRVARSAVEEHLAGCAACLDQVVFERGIRERLRSLPSPQPAAAIEDRVRGRLRKTSRPRTPMWLGVAAGLIMCALWVRGGAGLVGWQLARDHDHCFGFERLRAQVWTNDPDVLAQWYRSRGTEVPVLPAAVKGLELVGGRHCPLLDRRVAHVYYASGARHLSLYVVPGYLRLERTHAGTARGKEVRILRSGGAVVGLVSEDGEMVDAFRHAFVTTVARWSHPADPPFDPDPAALLQFSFSPVGL